MATKDYCRAAFPRAAEGDRIMVDEPGMTLRQWYAGQALAGLLAADVRNEWKASTVAPRAVTMADALIAELDR